MENKTEKIRKCTWCRQAPSNSRFVHSVDHWCDLQYVDAMEVDDWNARQVKLIFVRKADFEAGRLVFLRSEGEVPVWEDFTDYIEHPEKAG